MRKVSFFGAALAAGVLPTGVVAQRTPSTPEPAPDSAAPMTGSMQGMMQRMQTMQERMQTMQSHMWAMQDSMHTMHQRMHEMMMQRAQGGGGMQGMQGEPQGMRGCQQRAGPGTTPGTSSPQTPRAAPGGNGN